MSLTSYHSQPSPYESCQLRVFPVHDVEGFGVGLVLVGDGEEEEDDCEAEIEEKVLVPTSTTTAYENDFMSLNNRRLGLSCNFDLCDVMRTLKGCSETLV